MRNINTGVSLKKQVNWFLK